MMSLPNVRGLWRAPPPSIAHIRGCLDLASSYDSTMRSAWADRSSGHADATAQRTCTSTPVSTTTYYGTARQISASNSTIESWQQSEPISFSPSAAATRAHQSCRRWVRASLPCRQLDGQRLSRRGGYRVSSSIYSTRDGIGSPRIGFRSRPGIETGLEQQKGSYGKNDEGTSPQKDPRCR